MNKIHIIRGEKVMLDNDLAKLYGVTTGNLNKAVKRNMERFPKDFMFQPTGKELKNLIFQIGTSSWGGTRKHPYAFTEQGVAMLSSVLRSKRAVQVNIQIIRVYTKMRTFLSTHKDVLLKLEQLERKTNSHDEKIELIFDYIKQLIQQKNEPRKQIGYKISK
jgi:hypothetical protein